MDEQYQKYLCTREWNEKKQAIHERAGGICERCKKYDLADVHHLTYIRKYNENLEDLIGLCRGCHDFTHALSNDDPMNHVVLIIPTTGQRYDVRGLLESDFEPSQ